MTKHIQIPRPKTRLPQGEKEVLLLSEVVLHHGQVILVADTVNEQEHVVAFQKNTFIIWRRQNKTDPLREGQRHPYSYAIWKAILCCYYPIVGNPMDAIMNLGELQEYAREFLKETTSK